MESISFKNANDEQLKVIKHVEGPLLIIAGPGTGKTYTLINRALNLIINEHVEPSKIMFATFTEKAAHELITRLSDALEDNNIDFNPNEMYIGTFHSICLKILKEKISYTNLKKNFNLKDQFDQQYFIYQNLNKFTCIEGFDRIFAAAPYWDKCEMLMKYINRLEEEMIDYKELLDSKVAIYKCFGEIMSTYNKLRIENNFLDFSSIQTETYRMLINHPDLLKKIQNSIQFTMIDEYQDTNHIQEKLTFLFGANKNICVVGDDDQAIYRFRGATVRNILEFPTHFKDCKQIKLIKNYRSHKDIVNFYNEWMEKTKGREFEFDWDKFRYSKSITPFKKSDCKEPTVIQLSTKEEKYINKKTLDFIKELLKSKKVTDLNQIAFLFRSVKNDSVKLLANYLEENNIPVYSPRSNMFFDRNEIKLLIGTIILLFPKYQSLVVKRECNSHMATYYIGCLSYVKGVLSKPEYKEFIDWMRFRIRDHVFINKNLDYAFSSLVYHALEFEPFASLLDVNLKSGVHDSRTTRNVGLFIQLLVKFEYLNNISVLTVNNIEKTTNKLFNQYFRFLYEGGISEYEDESEYAPSGCVSFLTIHQSKGLEFPIVIVGSQSSTPRKQYIEEIEDIVSMYSGRKRFENLELIKMYDFWRLFYVAFSRAQSLLVLLCDQSKINEPSKYFEYIYDELPHSTNYSKFDFELIKNSNIKNSYSFTSDINAYLICPTQYKFYKELGFEPVRMGSTLFGTVVHETIEDIHKAVINSDTSSITNDNIKNWLEINYKTASKLNNYYLSETILKSAYDQVLSYVDKASKNWDSIKDAEMPISLSKKDYIIKGKVDLFLNSNGEYEILDFKTEQKPQINKEKEKVERVRRQLEIYAHLIENRYNINISSMKIYYTSEKNGNPYLTFKNDKEHVRETIKVFDSVVKSIENKEFSGKCSDTKICKNCDLRHYCKRR